jgi:uncharacterized protein (TIGR00297 family)
MTPAVSWTKNATTNLRPFSAARLTALGSAAVFTAIFLLLRRPGLPPARWLEALAVTAAFALLARLARGVDWSGTLAGAAVAFILIARGPALFLVLLLVFALTLAATRVGRTRKQELRTAEPLSGRTASQVMANLGVAALLAALAPAGWPLLVLAALAEVAADTSSSEIGMAFPAKTILITTWSPVVPGTDGGISLRGTAAAVVAAALVAASGSVLGLISVRQAAIVLLAGFLGTLADSLLGALLERPGWLTNDLVNLLSTAVAAGIAWAMMG